MTKLLGLHFWKTIGNSTPEEYHRRKKNMLTIYFLGLLFTIKIRKK